MESKSDILRNQTAGITKRIAQLRATEGIFLQRSAVEREALKAKTEIGEIETEIGQLKEELEKCVALRDGVINSAVTGLLSRLQALLPFGEPSITVQDGVPDISVIVNGAKRQYKALSGGERVAFDIAMAAAMGSQLIIKEASELDDDRMQETLSRLKDVEPQVILVSCHDLPETTPAGWEIAELKITNA
jgi:DNA repair exonuclease SbcCD ATPase subunit